MYLVGFPLLLIPFAIYNIIAFLIPGVGWTDALTRVSFPAGGEWAMSLGDILVALSILCGAVGLYFASGNQAAATAVGVAMAVAVNVLVVSMVLHLRRGGRER